MKCSFISKVILSERKKWETNSYPRSQVTWLGIEDVKNEELCKLLRRDRVVGRNEESLLGETINNDQYSSITGR